MTPEYFQNEGDWYIRLPLMKEGSGIGPFPNKEDAEEYWNMQSQIRCKDCEE